MRSLKHPELQVAKIDPGNSPTDVIAQQSAVDKFLFHLLQTMTLNVFPAWIEDDCSGVEKLVQICRHMQTLLGVQNLKRLRKDLFI